MTLLILGLFHTIRVTRALPLVAVTLLLAAGALAGCSSNGDDDTPVSPPSDILSGAVAVSPTTAPTAAGFGALPGRTTASPPASTQQPTPIPSTPITPLATSPFVFPTSSVGAAALPARDCTTVYPLENVETIAFGQTTIAQLEASFGYAEAVNGRPPRFRFEEDGCLLLVTVGTDEALEAELVDYGTLDLLLDRYGPPAVTGISQGNLTLMLFGNAVLLYPQEGIIAIFDAGFDDLTGSSTVMSLQFRPPYAVERQIARLHLQPVDWQPPTGPPGR